MAMLFHGSIWELMRTIAWQFTEAGQLRNKDDFKKQTYGLVLAAEEFVAAQERREEGRDDA